MAAPTGEHSQGMDQGVRFDAFVDTFLSTRSKTDPDYAHIPIAPDAFGVRGAVVDLRRQGVLDSLSVFDAEMGSDYSYGPGPLVSNMSISADTVDLKLFRPVLTLPQALQGEMLVIPHKSAASPENKMGACALASGQVLRGLVAFAERDGPDRTLGVELHFSRKLYPHGYVVYEQRLRVSSGPSYTEPELIGSVKCQIIYEAPEAPVKDGHFLDDVSSERTVLDSQWAIELPRPEAWMLDVLYRLGVHARKNL